MKKSIQRIVSVFIVFAIFIAFPIGWSGRAADMRYTRKFNQWSYKSTDYELYEAGCGLFSTGNAIYAMTGRTIDIAALKKWAKSVKGWTASAGLYRQNYFSNLKNSTFAKEYGFTVTGPTDGGITSNNKIIATQLQKGNVAAVVGVPGHYITITDYDKANNKYFVIEGAVYSGTDGRGLAATGWVSESKLSTGKTKVRNYTFLTFNYVKPISYTSIKAGDYYLKNKSTGTYLTVDGAKAANKQNISVAAKQTSNAFKFKVSGGIANYISSMINTSFVINPLSDNPSNGTNVTLYTKDNSGTQTWKFEAVSDGYIIHSGCNESCVLDVSGSNVLIKTKTGAANQVWILESADKQLSGISITTPATKTQYWRDETLQTDGLVLKANYSDGSSKNITSGFTTKYDFSQTGTRTVTISYTDNGVTKSTSYNVTVTHPFNGEGTSENPYIIANKNDLFRLAEVINNNKYVNYNTLYYKQTVDINLNNNEWTTIGVFYETPSSSTLDNNRTFNGNYDGDRHSVIGLKVDYNRNYAGLFGRINGSAVIENLSVNGSINGSGACTGGIVGKLHRGGTISTCYVNGVITATGDGSCAGGITSTIQIGDHVSSVNALIENCYFAGKVNAPINGALSSDIIIGTVNKSTASFYSNYYLENSASGAVGENEQSSCQKFSSEKLKRAAEYLGYPYVSTGANQNDGYPVFEWQRKTISGDINSDGKVDINDAVLLQGYLLGKDKFTKEQYETADINNDGSTDVYDMVLMRSLIIEK